MKASMDLDPSNEADVVVVGAGIAGLIAATRCAMGGLRVTVLEKSIEDRYVCNSRLTGGVFHLAYHDVFGNEDSIVQAIEASSANSADPILVRTVVQDAKRVVRWLESLGIRFLRGAGADWRSSILAPPPLPQLGRKWEGRGGDVALRTLLQKLEESGGTLHRGYRAQHISLESGRVTGIRGVRADGSHFSFASRAVVIADGGFQANKEMIGCHITKEPTRLVQRNSQTSIGDGLNMAREISAEITDLSAFYGHLLSRDALTNDRLWPYPYLDEIARVSLMIGADGLRFVDEGLGGVAIANTLAKKTDPAEAFVVFDQSTWEGPGRQRALPPNPTLASAGATIYQAASLPELAQLCHVPAAAFSGQIEAYNTALKNQTLAQMVPRRSIHKYDALPIVRAPYFAIPVVPGITYTMGGVRINQDSCALHTSGSPISGVYAVGGATGGIEGGPASTYVGGLSISGVTGLRAAEHILKATTL